MIKLEKITFYLFVFCIPFQTRTIIRSWGIGFNEWESAFLYLTDLFILALLGFWFLRGGKKGGLEINFQKQDWFLVGFIVFSGISLLKATNVDLGIYQLLKILEFVGLYFYIKSNFSKIFNFKNAFLTLIVSGLFQSIIAIGQYIKQASLGLKILGESNFEIGTPGIASFIVNGWKTIRAYGTTPHPNVLALFLFVCVFSFFALWLYSKDKQKNKKDWWFLLIYGVSIFGFLFTFSRVFIGLFTLGVIIRILIFLFKKEFRVNKNFLKRFGALIVFTLIIGLIFTAAFWSQAFNRLNISGQEEAVTLRMFYQKVTLEKIPLLGIGTGNFVVWLSNQIPNLNSSLYQPVHSIYFLIMKEIGLFGLLLFLAFLILLFIDYLKKQDFSKFFSYSFLILCVSILVSGLFDHLLWTSQQGSILLWTILGMAGALNKRQE